MRLDPLPSDQALAIEGGIPVRTAPLPVALGGAMLGEAEKQAVLEVLESGSLFRYYGPVRPDKTERLEGELATTVGRQHALAVSSGTAALRCALKALEIGPGDEVLVPGYSFLACATAVLTVGAIPVFVECDESLLLDADDAASKLTPCTRALLVVHTNGAAADLDRCLELCRQHDIALIEDCAQALGASYRGRPVGSFGEISTLSFQYLKVITSGEGGAVLSDDQRLYQRAESFHDLGFERPGRSGVPVVGENLRMGELPAAVALAQLARLPEFVARMRAIHRELSPHVRDLDGLQLRRVPDPDGDIGSCLVFGLETDSKAKFFRRAMRAEGIHIDGCHAKVCTRYRVIAEALPEASCARSETLLRRIVSIPLSPALTDADAHDIAAALAKVAAHLPSR